MKLKQLINTLPGTESLRMLSQSLAILDAIMSPEWESRYYSFDAKWGRKKMMASMNNGQGDHYFIFFSPKGVIIKGFDHESPMSPYANEPAQVWSGVLDEVPSDFRDFLVEPAFTLKDTTFCFWRRNRDSSWQTGEIAYPDDSDPDGADSLLSILDGNPATYQKFAQEYYEGDVPLSAVKHIYQHKPLTDKIVTFLNPENSLSNLKAEIKEIGYPQNTTG